MSAQSSSAKTSEGSPGGGAPSAPAAVWRQMLWHFRQVAMHSASDMSPEPVAGLPDCAEAASAAPRAEAAPSARVISSRRSGMVVSHRLHVSGASGGPIPRALAEPRLSLGSLRAAGLDRGQGWRLRNEDARSAEGNG